MKNSFKEKTEWKAAMVQNNLNRLKCSFSQLFLHNNIPIDLVSCVVRVGAWIQQLGALLILEETFILTLDSWQNGPYKSLPNLSKEERECMKTREATRTNKGGNIR